MDEIIKRDQNHVTTLAGVTNDANQFVTMLRVDPTTKRLLVAVTGGGGGGITSINGDTTAAQLFVAGTNISIVDNGSGSHTISASGGGTGYTKATPTGSVNSSNTVYGVVAVPVYVVADGSTYFDGAGYVYGGGNITMTNPPTQFIRYFY